MRASPTTLTGPPRLYGRTEALAELDADWDDPQVHVVTIVAWGGVGKTALVNEWRNRLCARPDGPTAVFDCSFASQGIRDRVAVSADAFLSKALRFFGEDTYAKSNASPLLKGSRLAEVVGQQRALLILDGLEPLQAPSQGMGLGCALREESIANLLRCLAQNSLGLCVVTTREPVHDLTGFEGTTVHRRTLAHLTREYGAELLYDLLTEDEPPRPVESTPAERAEISDAVDGHALTLQLLGVYIRHALGDIRRWREIDFERASDEQGGRAFHVMAAYVRWLSAPAVRPGLLARGLARIGLGPKPTWTRGQQQVAALRLMGFFDRSADPGCIAALLLRGPAIAGVTEPLVGLDAEGWRSLVSSLEALRLVTRSEYQAPRVAGYDEATARRAGEEGRSSGPPQPHPLPDMGPGIHVLDAHPLVREFFARDLRRTTEAGWREGHRRLYEHLCASVPYWPEGIEGLQPLYQAVVHGCAAGQIRDACILVYRARIGRGARYYSTNQLGAINADLAAIACFFERPWDRPSTALAETERPWVLGEAAFRLRALGRLSDALAPMRAGLEMRVQHKAWKNAARAANNLSELELTVGHTSAAVEIAAQAVEHADTSKDDFLRMAMRATLANARHQAGDPADARALLEQAEVMQAKVNPTEPWLYSLNGHHYCDLLLSPAERAAWRRALGDPKHDDGGVTSCQEAVARATRALALARQYGWLLDIAMDHLTLGRAALYAAILRDGSAAPEPALSFAAARTHLDAAVDGLRRAGHLGDLPGALLTRAWLRHRDSPDLARADLDEAWTLAERGPMPLFQADIQLTRARLFRDPATLARARALIDRHGYGRRRDELADAERVALTWPALNPPTPTSTRPSPRSTPMPTPPWDPKQRPDIAILIALPEEFRSIAADYSQQWYVHRHPDHPGSDFLFLGPGGYRCTATIMPRMGPTVASEVSMRLLGLRPAAIVNIGIAGSLKSDDLRIGDVIVPRQVDAYDETGKIEGVRWQPRGSDYRPSATLVADVQQLEFTSPAAYGQWRADGARDLAALRGGPDATRIAGLMSAKLLRDQPNLSTNHLASGSFVVASKPFAEFLRGRNADTHAGEMEAAGMMAAAEYWREQPKTLVVRGISDHVDADKKAVDAVGEGALRRLAMANAWRLVRTLMHLNLLPRSDAPAATSAPSGPLAEWQKKLAFLLAKEPTTYDHNAQYSLQASISEARAKIREYGGEP